MHWHKPADRLPTSWAPELKVPQHTLWLPAANEKPLKELDRQVALNVLGMGTP